ncbi:MAG: hypothetical protein EOO50_10180 [Flavobacterium sp.]|uniref:hypothetical protein n=1 Tax=Flavobacterium sp. TaxID=239 RepID=UPI00120C2F8D|nr:hypothetical protein [Flavobacterium sp.]RZJ66290.1 MAG: hypothetical protein EOO50_10180 [Flavobacterium sp.]
MELLHLIVSSFIGTCVMTSFSYMISESFGQMYREPALLGYIIQRLNITVSDRLKNLLGWALHYATGIIFTLCFLPIWISQGVTVANTLIMGTFAGIAGILSWMVAFRLSPEKPKIDYLGYYAQLFVAHFLFTAGASFAWSATQCMFE